MRFDLDSMNGSSQIYKLMSQTIIPRPIAWVVTEDEGVVNVAPFSYFIGLSSDPAMVLVSVGHKADGTPKDTLLNIRKHKRCTICMVEENDLEKMHFSSVSLSHEKSEAVCFDIETETMKEGYPPKIVSSPVAYFCELFEEIALGGKTVPLILKVNEIFVDERIITDTEKMQIDFKPVARIGKKYAFLGEEIDAPTIPELPLS